MPGCPATSSRLCRKTSIPVPGAPSYAVFRLSACSYVPSVSSTTRSTGSSPSASLRPGSPDSVRCTESKVRTANGRPSASHRSCTVSSQSAYGVVPAPGGRSGGRSQVACGSSKSTAGGSSSASARYTATGSFATSTVQSSPAYRCRNRGSRSSPTARSTCGWLDLPSANRRCRSLAARSPSSEMPTRTPSSSNSSQYASSSRTPLVCTRRSSSHTSGSAARSSPAARRNTSGPASNGSPPCRTTRTAVSPCAAACSPIRSATRVSTTSVTTRGLDRQPVSACSYT